VALHDVDAAGILFFGHLFRHAHDAYEAFMADIGFPLDRLIREGAGKLPLVHAEADYALPMRHGEEVEARLQVESLGRTSFTLSYRFLDAAGRECASASTVHVYLAGDPSGLTAHPLPKVLRTLLQNWTAVSAED
jgi:1,4-dihydroxy-2-naphthoyl-CoA hydrolase